MADRTWMDDVIETSNACLPNCFRPEPKPLTAAMLRAAVEQVREAELEVHVHVVHPMAKGWTMCGSCFGPVWVGDGVLADD